MFKTIAKMHVNIHKKLEQKAQTVIYLTLCRTISISFKEIFIIGNIIRSIESMFQEFAKHKVS